MLRTTYHTNSGAPDQWSIGHTHDTNVSRLPIHSFAGAPRVSRRVHSVLLIFSELRSPIKDLILWDLNPLKRAEALQVKRFLKTETLPLRSKPCLWVHVYERAPFEDLIGASIQMKP